MWGNFLSSGDRITSALERTGDAITRGATSYRRNQKEQEKREAKETTIVEFIYEDNGVGDGDGDGGSTSSKKTESLKRNVDHVNDGVKKSNENDKSNSNTVAESKTEKGENANESTEAKSSATSSDSMPRFAPFSSIIGDGAKGGVSIDSLRLGWGSVVEATKNVVESTRNVVEEERNRIHASLAAGGGKFGLRTGPYKRDLSLPLDKVALRDAEVVYVTDRVITLSHPAMQSATNGDITSERKLAAVAHLLDTRHQGHYMVFNLSELDYDYSILNDQTMTYRFPGNPSPPLGLMLKIILGIESWLKADERNVAAVHCLTGKGRTSTVVAAFLCWTGEAGFGNIDSALEYIACCKRVKPDRLVIPSQRRYASYFSNMLDGVRPSQPPLLLKRVIMSEAPKFGKRPMLAGNENASESPPSNKNDFTKSSRMGCAPYLQVFKAGSLVFTTAASVSHDQAHEDLPFCLPSDGPVFFPVETVIQGDILVRCRHLSSRGKRVSMFRVAFHTGYVPPKVLRLTKEQLDGACDEGDDRFPDGFFLDLIFEPCNAEMASKHIVSEDDMEDELKDSNSNKKETSESVKDEYVSNEAAARRNKGTISGSSSGMLSASAYDSMLHRDSRFWEVISKQKERYHGENSIDVSDNRASSYGPTIGRRRDFIGESSSNDTNSNDADSSNNEAESSLPSGDRNHKVDAFTIGGEFDFVLDDKVNVDTPSSSSNSTSKKDDLMEALMALDDDADIGIDSPVVSPEKEISKETSLEKRETDSDDIHEDDSIHVKINETGNTENEIKISSLELQNTDEEMVLKEPQTLESEKSINDGSSVEEVLNIKETTSSSSSLSLEANYVHDEHDHEDEAMNNNFDGEEDFDFDEEDEELEDLENFLKQTSKST